MESVEIRTTDGVSLRADVREPPAGVRPVAVAVLAHAMFARRSEFTRKGGTGLAPFLSERGVRTVAFDFRGHGESGRPASKGFSWTYDDLVLRDLPAVVGCVRDRWPDLPLVLVGHSLGAHTSLASIGVGAMDVDAVVAFACSPWHPAFEPSHRRQLKKRMRLEAMHALTRAVGYLPARRLRLGSDDECARYVEAIVRPSREGVWRSEDFRYDYMRALGKVKAPVFAISSEGDRLTAPPVTVDRMLGFLGAPADHLVLHRADAGGPPPDHMGIVTSTVATSAWQKAFEFVRGVANGRSGGKTRNG